MKYALGFFGLLSIAASAGHALADETFKLPPVVVSPTRNEESSFDVPVSIDAFGKEEIQEGQPEVNASEMLQKAPGVVANTRQNYAQDLQISIRGFGARSTFGIRGIRLYADGVPLTQPDGQGQANIMDLGSARSMEVMRGPFSALYGNASGGVIQVFTEDGPAEPTLTASGWFGTFGSSKVGLKFGGQADDVNYIGNLSNFHTDGYRDHSAATRTTFNGKVKYEVDADSTLAVTLNVLDQPNTQDPLGITKAQFQQNPKQVDASAITFNTRKSQSNYQSGAVYERMIGADDTIRATGYVGKRLVDQYLAVPVGAQVPANSGGGEIGLDNLFGGFDGRWTHKGSLFDRPYSITAGANYDVISQAREGWENFVTVGGVTTTGVRGRQRRDETDTVYNLDQYAQAEWAVAEQWVLSAGFRHDNINFDSKDHFVNIIPGNGDDSGSVTFDSVTPIAGLVFKATPDLNFYASFGEGFETPSISELAYRPGGGAGLNTDLGPSESRSYEVGVKATMWNMVRMNLALFRTDTENELSVLSNNGGRTVYQNVGKTTRKGVEVSFDSYWGAGFGSLVSFTYLEANFNDPFLTCTASGCSAANVPVPAGNRIPGIPKETFYGEVQWATDNGVFSTALEGRYVSPVYANDTNSVSTDPYGLMNWRAVLQQKFGRLKLTGFVRVDNLLDTVYAGSVIVNEGSGRFFESGTPRSFVVGMSGGYAF
ncbi:MAG: TonB-dependent receptor [Alphaproteobacteria bacterium]